VRLDGPFREQAVSWQTKRGGISIKKIRVIVGIPVLNLNLPGNLEVEGSCRETGPTIKHKKRLDNNKGKEKTIISEPKSFWGGVGGT